MIATSSVDPATLFQTPSQLLSFPSNSRYYGVAAAEYVAPDGTRIAYLRRALRPAPERLASWQEHRVVQGDRLDRLAFRYLGDPELFWRICDANAAMRPDALTERIGRVLRITLPEGVPGLSDA